MIGANVFVVGTSRGTITDTHGHYRVRVPSLQDTLRFTYIGYQTKTIPIDGRTTINIQLKPVVISGGNQLVVIGYGKKKKQNLTEAVSVVSGEELMKAPAINVGNMLAGKTTGLMITQTSGLPGGDHPSIFIRGVSTLKRGRSHPLYVVDGVRRSIFQLDPTNIKSISVLKGPAATAIYGVRGANGVIVVTTKRGQKGPAQISVNVSVGIQRPTNLPEFVGSYRYAKLYNKAQMSDNVGPLRFSDEAIKAFKTGKYPLIYPSTDWVDYISKPVAFQTRNSISISGGSDDVRYYISGGFVKQDGLFRTFDQSYDFNPSLTKYNFRANLDMDITPSTLISLTSYGRIEKRVRLAGGNGWTQIFRGAPFAGAGIVNGKLIDKGYGQAQLYIPGNKLDPLLRFYGAGYNEYVNNVMNVDLSVQQELDFITKGLQFEIKASYNTHFSEKKHYRHFAKLHYMPYFKVDLDPSVQPGEPGDSTIVFKKLGQKAPLVRSEDYAIGRHWYIEARLNYKRSFGRNNISGLLLFNQEKTFYPHPFVGIPRGLVGLVGRVNYNYDERYLLEFNMGFNGTENFAKGRRFGFFPSISAGWILTNESFMKNVDFLNFLKIRAAYGIVGNARGVGRFLYLPTRYFTNKGAGYSFGYQIPQNQPSAKEGQLGNPLVHWETAKKQDYAISMKLFQSRLQLSFDYYRQDRTNILTTRNTVPAYVAANLPAVNLGEVKSHGFEAEIKWHQSLGNNFSYHINPHVTFAKNKIVKMDEPHRPEPYLRRTGYPVGQKFGYIFAGFFTLSDFNPDGKNPKYWEGDYANADFVPNSGYPKYPYKPMPGDMKFKDLNADGVINAEDQRAIGYPIIPEYSFGVNLGFRFKNFEVSMLWTGATHVSRMLYYEPYRTGFGPGGQGWWSLLKWQADGAWTPKKGKKSTYPRLSTTIGQRRNNMDSDFWLKNASYLRLKNAVIAYNLPNNVLNNLGIQNMRLYVKGYDLLTFSPIKKYSLDPESFSAKPGRAAYPIMKVFTFGFHVDF